MGLEEPDIDLDELLKDSSGDGDDSGDDISDMSKKEVYKLVQKKGQINLGDNRALIACPCSDSDMFGGYTTNYMCALSMRPDPEDGKQKPVCSGPVIGMKYLNGDPYKWQNGKRVRKGCPYSPFRFGEDED